MNEAKEQIVDNMSAAQLEKIRLEIESLRSKNKWEDRVARYVPLLTAVVAVVGFLFGIFQFQAQQKVQQERVFAERQKDRTTQDADQKMRIHAQIRSDAEQLLQFTTDRVQTVSRVSFLLGDLESLIERPASEHEKTDNVFDQNRQTITHTLVRLIHYDCDFIRNPRDVYFTSTVIDHWPDYSNYLRQDINELKYILYKYIRAVRELHKTNPTYFEEIEYDRFAGRFIVLAEKENEEQQFQHYGEIVIGFKKHLELLSDQHDLREAYIEDFQNALCNPNITEQIFGKAYPSRCSHTSITTSLRDLKTDKMTAARGVETDLSTIVLSATRSNEGSENDIRLTPSTKRVILVVGVDGAAVYGSFRVSIFNIGNQPVWRGYLKPDRYSGLSILFHASFLKSGMYILKVEGLTHDGNYTVYGIYSFRIIKR